MNIKNIHISGFTLIELMIVCTIIGLISLATYIPYAHHQKKVLVKQATKELSQTLSEAKNLAMHGLDIGSGNVNVGIYFSSGATQIDYYTSTGILDIVSLPASIYKTKQLPKGVKIIDIGGKSGERFINFSSITGSGTISGQDTGDEIIFTLSYKGSDSPILQKKLRYFKKSSISDY